MTAEGDSTPRLNSSPEGRVAVEGVTFNYPATDQPALQDVTLRIEPGEFAAVVGGNGSGKTTLCKSFNGLVPHFYEGRFEGTVTVAGMDTRAESVATLSQQVGYVFQDFEDQLVQPTVFEDVAFAPLNHGLADYEGRANAALRTAGIDSLRDRFVWELSGGQQHLVALAGVLALDPQIIVVDEPAAQLDARNARNVYECLRRLHRDYGKTIVVIEHQTELVAEYCKEVVMMADGCVRWKEPVEIALNRTGDLRNQGVHPPQITRVAEVLNERGLFDGDRYPITVDEGVHAFQSPSMLLTHNQRSRLPSRRRGGRSIVTFDGVTHGYQTLREGRTVVLDDLDLELRSGNRTALVGGNGAGKSTLLRLITGTESPDNGQVTVLNESTSETLPERIADHVAYLPQQPEDVFLSESVKRDIEHYPRARNAEDIDSLVDEVRSLFAIDDLMDRDGRLLSRGQQRRASLAIASAMRPVVLLLDEPTGCLDLASRHEVVQMLERMEQHIETVVIATHDVQLISSWADRVLVLDEGQVIADAPPVEIFDDTELLERADIRAPPVIELSTKLGIELPTLTTEALIDTLSEYAEVDERELL